MIGSISKRVQAVEPSQTLAITARAKALQAEGRDVVVLAAGEPDVPTPPHIVEAAVRAMQDGHTRYTPASGIVPLRETIAEALTSAIGRPYGPKEVVVSCGAKHAIFNVLQALCEPGDQVLIPAPYWVSYPEQVKLAGGEPVVIPTLPEDGFRLTAAAVEAVSAPRGRLLILNSPCNPTGAIIPQEAIQAIAEIARSRGWWVLTDEIYDRMIYTKDAYRSFLHVAPDLADQTIVVNGPSKTYSMTGWRVGYAAGPAEVIAAVGTLQSQSTSNPSSISQHATLAAMRGDQQCVRDMVTLFTERRNRLTEVVAASKSLTLSPPDGAFYGFVQLPPECQDSMAFAGELLEEHGVAVIPGAPFGQEGYVRVSFAAAEEVLVEGVNRMVSYADHAIGTRV